MHCHDAPAWWMAQTIPPTAPAAPVALRKAEGGAAGVHRRAVPATGPAEAAGERDGGGAGTSPSSRRWKIKLLP